MSQAKTATANSSPNYERHQPEQGLLYPLIEKHYPVYNLKTAVERQICAVAKAASQGTARGQWP